MDYVLYGITTGFIGAPTSLYQLLKLTPNVKIKPQYFARLSLKAFPIHAALKTAQIAISTPIKEEINPWAAFGIIGALQGGIYGQLNIYFGRALNISSGLTYAMSMRGMGYAMMRDTFSQGFPYIFTPKLDNIIDNRPVSIISTSIFSTIISHPFHVLQVTMQTNPQMNYYTSIENCIRVYGSKMLYKGVEARLTLLLSMNIINDTILRKFWENSENVK